MSSSKARAEKEREKQVQEKVQAMLGAMLKDEDNKYCVDCDSKGPRWASWNLGIFLCIRCAGIHRNLGVHISKVRSVNLDSWTPQQVASMQMMGNSRARAVYEATLPDDYRRPQNDQAVEAFIRQKYEKKKYIASEWTPSKPPDFPVGWDEAGSENQAKKPEFKKLTVASQQPKAASSSPVPAPVRSPQPKPPAVAVTSKPATAASNGMVKSASTLDTDLLGLSLSSSSSSTPSSASSSAVPSSASAQDLLGLNSEFSAFVSASPTSQQQQQPAATNNVTTPATTDTADSGKKSIDSIMALFGPKPTPAPPMQNFSSPNNQFGGLTQLGGMQQQFGGLQQQPQQQAMFGQFQQPTAMFPQQQAQQGNGGAFAGLGQLGQPPQQSPAFNQAALQPNQQNNIFDMNMFAKPGPQINYNQTPANNPFLDSNQLNGLSNIASPSLWQ